MMEGALSSTSSSSLAPAPGAAGGSELGRVCWGDLERALGFEVARFDFGKQELAVLGALVRGSVGRRRRWVVAGSQRWFVERTGLNRTNVSRALQDLVLARVVIGEKVGAWVRYGMELDADVWQVRALLSRAEALALAVEAVDSAVDVELPVMDLPSSLREVAEELGRERLLSLGRVLGGGTNPPNGESVAGFGETKLASGETLLRAAGDGGVGLASGETLLRAAGEVGTGGPPGECADSAHSCADSAPLCANSAQAPYKGFKGTSFLSFQSLEGLKTQGEKDGEGIADCKGQGAGLGSEEPRQPRVSAAQRGFVGELREVLWAEEFGRIGFWVNAWKADRLAVEKALAETRAAKREGSVRTSPGRFLSDVYFRVFEGQWKRVEWLDAQGAKEKSSKG